MHLMSSLEELDIKALIQKCIMDDRAAQKQLYMRFYSFGLGICMRYVPDKNQAISCYNDGMLKVFNNLEKFDLSRDFKPWFKTILVNTILNYLRKENKTRNSVDLGYAINLGSNENTTSGLRYNDLLKIVQKLSTNYRTVFNMYVIDGYNHQEIAMKLNIKVSTSRSNLTRAKVKLRELLHQVSTLEYE